MNLILTWISDESRRKRYRARCLNSGRRLLRILNDEWHKYLNTQRQCAIEAILGRLDKAGPYEMSVSAFNLFASEYEGWNRAQLRSQCIEDSRICARYIITIKRNLSPEDRTLLQLNIRDSRCREDLEGLKDVIQTRLSDAASEAIAASSSRGRFLNFRPGGGGKGASRGGRPSDPHKPNPPPETPCKHCRAAGKGDMYHCMRTAPSRKQKMLKGRRRRPPPRPRPPMRPLSAQFVLSPPLTPSILSPLPVKC